MWCDIGNTLIKPGETRCTPTSLDDAIREHLQPIIQFERYIPASEFCPYIGFQGKKALKNVGVDPGGFCQYWTLFYIDARLSKPDVPREELIASKIETISKGDAETDFGEFIRSYAVFLEIMVRVVVDNEDKSREGLVDLISGMIEEFTDTRNYEKPPEPSPPKKKPPPKPKQSSKRTKCKRNAKKNCVLAHDNEEVDSGCEFYLTKNKQGRCRNVKAGR